MKKFDIKKIDPDSWMVSHNELPIYLPLLGQEIQLQQDYNWAFRPYRRPKQIQLLLKMEKWLSQYHMDKIDG